MSQKDVSRDVIEVNLYGPQCINLTVIDLPGIVRTCGKEEKESIVSDIQVINQDYLENPRVALSLFASCFFFVFFFSLTTLNAEL